MKAKQTIQEVSEQVLKLQSFLEQQSPGATLTYLEIEQATGVRMAIGGRNSLRRAAKRSQLEYSCLRGAGIRLADAGSCMPIIGGRLTRINSAVKRADRCQKLMQQQFYNALPADEQRRVLFIGAVFGAIRLAAEQGKQLYGKKQRLLEEPTIRIPLPDIK